MTHDQYRLTKRDCRLVGEEFRSAKIRKINNYDVEKTKAFIFEGEGLEKYEKEEQLSDERLAELACNYALKEAPQNKLIEMFYTTLFLWLIAFLAFNSGYRQKEKDIAE